MNIEHRERQRWCAEASEINRQAGGGGEPGAMPLDSVV